MSRVEFTFVGPNELSIRNPDAVVPIYGPHGWEKGMAYSAIAVLKGGEPALQDIRSQYGVTSTDDASLTLRITVRITYGDARSGTLGLLPRPLSNTRTY